MRHLVRQLEQSTPLSAHEDGDNFSGAFSFNI